MDINNYPIWHPFTQMKTASDPITISKSYQEYLETSDGRKIIDGISSWWVTTHGHCHPKIVEAIQNQVTQLEQVIFAGFSHEPAHQLSTQLLKLWDDHFNKVFFSDDGSTAVEVAIKMSIQSRVNSGNKKKKKIIALEHAYHGDTFGAMAAGARSSFSEPFDSFLFEVIRIPSPGEFPEKSLESLRSILKNQHEEITGCIVEPLVQGAGGMLMWPNGILSQFADACKHFDVHLIADEIMTGFGRTGTLFACQHEQVFPDILCLSKGLTGGFLPLSVTLCTDEIYSTFHHDDRKKTFFHGHSFTANPIACAAANASLLLFQTDEPWQGMERIKKIHTERKSEYSRLNSLENIRQMGTIFAIDIKTKLDGYLHPIGPQLYAKFLSRNCLIRPLGTVIYLLPPYCISESNLNGLHDVILEELQGKL